ncbi:hypothetical protein H9635_10195 [Solibacillus sp. A46]|uniref:Uncharacterized protein n=1 Tax=Solibacillus faecavium TaxID=2762221 RepID=A0ABR8XYT2_9BACL|nr:hypothetical protein [Solibacillus faecavium]MBD8037116.1 hypothetical protein [Solibacillus faecavium]
MKLTEAYTIFNNNLHSMDPQLAEAIDRILDDKNKQLEKLDGVELAEAKARIEIERLREELIHVRELWRYGSPSEVYENIPRIVQMILNNEKGEWIG